MEGDIPGETKQLVERPKRAVGGGPLLLMAASCWMWRRPPPSIRPPPSTTTPSTSTRSTARLERALEVIETVSADFARRFGRDWGGALEPYRVEDAEALIVTMGSMAATARQAVDAMRADGKAVGLLKVRSFRPFPLAEVQRYASAARSVDVVDRNIVRGLGGALYREVMMALAAAGVSKPVIGFVAGLGGREVALQDMEGMAAQALEAAVARRPRRATWSG